ncbi:MAG: FkbM family methyltransferase [Devosia sp.]
MRAARLIREAEITPAAILHVGAHTGEAALDYSDQGIAGYHVEALPSAFADLEATCASLTNQTAINACVDDSAGQTVTFHVATKEAASSLLPFGRHQASYPNIKPRETIELTTDTIDGLVAAGTVPASVDFLVIDAGGAEARVLEGAKALLASGTVWGIVAEVASEPLYEGGASFDSLYADVLKPAGYYLKMASFNPRGWTDALFLKRWWPNDTKTPPPLAAHVSGRESDLHPLLPSDRSEAIARRLAEHADD